MYPIVTVPDFESFYEGTSRRLLRYAYGLTGDLAEAQDLTQEAYARAWRGRANLAAALGYAAMSGRGGGNVG
ncbi:RNA polymerase sigma factor [Allorhizocola rhizosphaerae]|uniref:RNA polymerase sigma factor n=1 Tax=Allorhizocola rhizosphaerae TaxID=1872709 RepID=UPI003CCC67E0